MALINVIALGPVIAYLLVFNVNSEMRSNDKDLLI